MPVGEAHARRWRRLLTGIVVPGALAVGAVPARAQFADRAALPWRTLSTPHFRFIFTDSLSTWALPVAARFEAVRSAVDAAVGWTPAQRVTVVMDDPITVSNGLAWSPNGRTMYWSDTKAHTIYAFDVDPASGALSRRVTPGMSGLSAIRP